MEQYIRFSLYSATASCKPESSLNSNTYYSDSCFWPGSSRGRGLPSCSSTHLHRFLSLLFEHKLIFLLWQALKYFRYVHAMKGSWHPQLGVLFHAVLVTFVKEDRNKTGRWVFFLQPSFQLYIFWVKFSFHDTEYALLGTVISLRCFPPRMQEETLFHKNSWKLVKRRHKPSLKSYNFLIQFTCQWIFWASSVCFS